MPKQSVWSVFGVDRKKEIDGVQFYYPGGVRVTLARAGGGNEQFAKAHEIHMRQHKAAAKLPGGMPEKLQRSVITEVYLDAVIRKFETDVSETDDPEYQPVIVMEDGQVLPSTRDNLKMLFTRLPDLLMEIVGDAQNLSHFRKEELEADAGN
jgi:hypothetical protein